MIIPRNAREHRVDVKTSPGNHKGKIQDTNKGAVLSKALYTSPGEPE